jgi:arylformamidase
LEPMRKICEACTMPRNVTASGTAIAALFVSVLSACSAERYLAPSQFVDLSQTIEPGLVEQQFGTLIAKAGYLPPPRFEDLIEDEPGGYSAMTVITMLNHLGSHHDAPRHVDRAWPSTDEIPLGRFYGRAKIFDFRSKGRNKPLLAADFEGTPIEPDDIVLAYVGYTPPDGPDELPTYPYLSADAARYLASLKIKAFGTDMPGLMSIVNAAATYPAEPGPEGLWPEHTILLSHNIVVIEGLTNLDRIVGQREVVFAGFPIKVKDGNGAPIRAVALIY